MSLYKQFARGIYSQLGYRATWLPGTPVKLGDVGLLEGGVLKVETNLDQLGFAYQQQNDTRPDGSLDYQSENAVSVTLKAAGSLDGRFKALAQAEAGALVEFHKKNAVLMQLRDIRSDRIADIASLKTALLNAVVAADDQGRWLRDWVVVTEVVNAGSGTILISGGSSSRLELKAEAKIVPVSLADVSAGLSTVAEERVSTKIVSQKGLTPLYRAIRVKQNFWWLYDEVVTATGTAPDPEELFGDATPDDDIDSNAETDM